MQDVNNMVKDILRANEENRLAIFIGAGVSANSGYKSWWQIVDRFNENKKYVENSDKEYTDEEILKIPQFVYNEDSELYFKILEEEYNKLPDETNPIINILLELQPNHIITTNFDRLIEYSIEKQHIYGNTMYEDFSKYSRIINDTGFIFAKKPHYFIKMHGDLEDRASIVLKEDDYLEFSATHSLVETFVKSLFVNHTILFVGYGLKDNNLKLIMSWVNSFTKKILNVTTPADIIILMLKILSFPNMIKNTIQIKIFISLSLLRFRLLRDTTMIKLFLAIQEERTYIR